jgi:hypothetical protein
VVLGSWTPHSCLAATNDAPTKKKPAADYSDPRETFRTYLRAVKKSDLAAAKGCWTISDGNKSGALDTIVGTWVTFHRFNNIMLLKFKEAGKPFARDDCTDDAIDRTLSRLPNSTFEIKGQTAELAIKWEKDDGYPNPVFCFGKGIQFRRVKEEWKIDGNARTGLDDPSDFFAPGGWGCAFRDQMNVTNEVIEEIDSGKLKTAEQVKEAMQQKLEAAMSKWKRDHERVHHSKDGKSTE